MPAFRDVEIVAATLGDNAGLAGAASLVWERQGSPAEPSQPLFSAPLFPCRKIGDAALQFLTRVKNIVDE